MALVSDGFEKFLCISLEDFPGILNAHIELLQTLLVPSQ